MILSKNFIKEEFVCKGSNVGVCACDLNSFEINSELIVLLELLRIRFGSIVNVVSGYRCKDYNRFVGGVSSSKHLDGDACDVIIDGVDSSQVYDYLCTIFPNKYGFGLYKSFVHLDVRGYKARW